MTTGTENSNNDNNSLIKATPGVSPPGDPDTDPEANDVIVDVVSDDDEGENEGIETNTGENDLDITNDYFFTKITNRHPAIDQDHRRPPCNSKNMQEYIV